MQKREEKLAFIEAREEDKTLYVETAGGAKSRNLCGVGSKGVDYGINSGNKITAVSKRNEGWIKSLRMERVNMKD